MAHTRQIHVTHANSINYDTIKNRPDLLSQLHYATTDEIFEYLDNPSAHHQIRFIVTSNGKGGITPMRDLPRGKYLYMRCRKDWGRTLPQSFYFLLVMVSPSPTSNNTVSNLSFSSKLLKKVLNPLTAVLCLCLL